MSGLSNWKFWLKIPLKDQITLPGEWLILWNKVETFEKKRDRKDLFKIRYKFSGKFLGQNKRWHLSCKRKKREKSKERKRVRAFLFLFLFYRFNVFDDFPTESPNLHFIWKPIVLTSYVLSLRSLWQRERNKDEGENRDIHNSKFSLLKKFYFFVTSILIWQV